MISIYATNNTTDTNTENTKESRMDTNELMKKILKIAPDAIFSDDNGAIQADTGLTPCKECEELMATDLHEEELGMCVDCSNAYFDHSDEYELHAPN